MPAAVVVFEVDTALWVISRFVFSITVVCFAETGFTVVAGVVVAVVDGLVADFDPAAAADFEVFTFVVGFAVVEGLAVVCLVVVGLLVDVAGGFTVVVSAVFVVKLI